MIKYVLLLFLFSGCMDVAVTDLVLYAAKHDCACDAGGHVCRQRNRRLHRAASDSGAAPAGAVAVATAGRVAAAFRCLGQAQHLHEPARLSAAAIAAGFAAAAGQQQCQPHHLDEPFCLR